MRQGIAEGNHIQGNRVGISIGHHDTDNLVTGNEILGSRARASSSAPNAARISPAIATASRRTVSWTTAPSQGFAVDIQGGTAVDRAGRQ